MIEVPDNDIEYYERKVVRMEQDISILQEELNRVRLKLRTAEDYQIKYRILIKNNEVDLQRTKIETAIIEEEKSRMRIAQALKQNDEHWTKVKQELETQLKQQASQKIEKLQAELQIANKKLKDISQKKEEVQLFSFKIRKFQKENAALEQQLADIRRACEREKNQQLASLRNQLNAGFKERLAAERQSNQARIQSLTKKLIEKQTQDNTNLTMPDLSNAQLVSLKELYSATKTSHERQIDKSQQTILRKNAQIKSLLREQSEREAKIQQILLNKNKQVSQLEAEITRLRKQHQEEVLELGKNMQVVKESQGQILKEQIKNLTDQIKQKEIQMSRLVQSYSQQIQSNAQRTRQQKARLVEENTKLEETIQKLRYDLRERQQRIAQLTSQLNSQKSRKYDDGDEAGQYQNGIIFLQRQLRRAEHKNQQNKQLYSKLQNDFQTYRKDSEEQIARLHNKLKQERNSADEKLRAAQNQIRELVQKLTAKSKQIIHSKKQFVTQKLSLEVQLRALKSELEELETDYNRLQQIRKGLQVSLKNQRLKGMSLPQKENDGFKAVQGDFQALYREKQEYLQRKNDENINKMTKQINKLNQKLKQLQLENLSLKKAHQRLSNEAQLNKQNARATQQKKIATIELELARQNNIYGFLLNKNKESNESKGLLGLSRRQKTQFLTPKTFK